MLNLLQQSEMSRRTRIKMGSRSKEKFTLAHHSQYASTTTYFPRAYSLLGEDITFPISVLPFYSNGKITYAGTVEDFFPKLEANPFAEEELRLVSISLSGHQYEEGSPKTNFLVLIFSMLCFCFYWLLSTSVYRRGRFPRYRTDDYATFLRIIERFEKVETVIINFQDNDLTPQKMAMLDQICSKTNNRTLVLRNLTYFIEVQGLPDGFPLMRRKHGVDFKFIWEKFLLQSQGKDKGEEGSRLLSDDA